MTLRESLLQKAKKAKIQREMGNGNQVLTPHDLVTKDQLTSLSGGDFYAPCSQPALTCLLHGYDGFNNSDMELVELCVSKAREIFGDTLPDEVAERLEAELDGILKHNYSPVYMLAYKIAKMSNDAGYPVWLRGSAGSMLVAYLLGISEFNPILNPLQLDLPFEVYAGLDGELDRVRVPCMDISVSDEFLSNHQEDLEKMFEPFDLEGKGFVKIYLMWADSTGSTGLADSIDLTDSVSSANPTNNLTGLTNPISSGNAIYINLIKCNNLTRIKRLEDITGVDAKTIPLDDEKTLSLFASADTLGVPEFESEWFQAAINTMNTINTISTVNITNTINTINTIPPKTFADLVKLYGLFCGTNTWDDNAEALIKSGAATLSQVIAHRDEVMVHLMQQGIVREMVYEIMENVRRGKGLTSEHRDLMLKSGIPQWYADSCDKIGYLFPLAHSMAFVAMALRLAWFKAHYLEEFRVVFDE